MQGMMMSRDPFRHNKPQRTGVKRGIESDPNDEAIISQADALFGSEAATAIAYCGLDAWFDDNEAEFRRFARVFRRLLN
jgi:hypothetical protein